jgi:hypothetical protein
MKKTILITLICIFIFLVVVESYIIGYGYYSNPTSIPTNTVANSNIENNVMGKKSSDKPESDAFRGNITVNETSSDKIDFLNKNENSIEGFTVDPNYEYITDSKLKNDELSIVTTDKNIYIKKDGKWAAVLKYGIKEAAYFTACEIVNINGEPYIFAGTSYNGIYYKSVKAKSFSQLMQGLKIPYATGVEMNYVETINKMVIINDYLYLGYSYSYGIQRIDLKEKHFKVQDTPVQLVNGTGEKITDFYFANQTLFATSNYAIYSFNENNSAWDIVQKKEVKNNEAEPPVKGIYLNPYAVSSEKKIDKYIKLANDLGLNAFVIDFKDDSGFVDYDTQVDLALKMKSKRKIVKIDYLLERCKQEKIRVIARIVCFRDPSAYDYNNNQFALWDYTTNAAWEGHKSEKWVDPFCEVYQQYLIDIAAELQAKGVNEIQFDYVRFPSDGEVYKVKYRFKKDIKSKNILLYSFFKKAKENLRIPVSADFYGYNCWYRMNEYIGQDLFLISNYLDAIYPMYYPSHFSKGFYRKGQTQYETNFYIYYHGTRRAFDNTQNTTAVRPWIQAFKMDVDMDYKDYIKAQLYGISNAGIDSYIFWNAGSEYSILYDIL